MERTPNKSQYTKLTLEKKILPPLLPGFELTTFRLRVLRANQQAIPAPGSITNEALNMQALEVNNFWAVSSEKERSS